MIISEYNMSSIYTGVVISLFDNIQLQRRGATPYTVPIVFADKDRLHKHLQEIKNKQSSTTQYQLSVPALSVSLTDMNRALDRQTNRMLKKKLVEIDSNTVTMNWNDTAMDFQFKMTLLSKSITEMQLINEFILGAFKNGLYYAKVKTPLYDTPINTPVVLNTASISMDNNDLEYGNDRLLSTVYDITVRGILHNNLTTDSKVITNPRLNLYADLMYKELVAQYQVVAL